MNTSDAKYQRRRQELVELLRGKGIANERVLEAIGSVPRHAFVQHGMLTRAYDDVALPIGHGVTISQPFTVAYQTDILGVKPDSRILEIGTGSGYQAAVLCEMGAQVFTIERIRPLYDKTSELLKRLGYRAVCRYGDGTHGWESVGPFDGILVTAGAESVPKPLLSQLRAPVGMKPGGRLIIPVGDRSVQQMHRITRMGDDAFEEEVLDDFKFVPLLSDTSR